jgi:hypothetical protein
LVENLYTGGAKRLFERNPLPDGMLRARFGLAAIQVGEPMRENPFVLGVKFIKVACKTPWKNG